ncbi:hypothetical protein ACHWQZ_G004547 [Mnemiopsis leidyi]
MIWFLLPLFLLTQPTDSSESDTSVTETPPLSVSYLSPNIDYKVNPTAASDLTPTSTTLTRPRGSHVTQTRRVTEFPRNDEDMVDRTIYVRGISEAYIILKREVEIHVKRDGAINYSLTSLQKNFKLKHLINVFELLSNLELHHAELKLHFGQKLLLFNKAAHRFEKWWTIRKCSDLNENFISKCRVVNINSNDVMINIPSDETPKIILLHNKNTTFSGIESSSVDNIQCFNRKHYQEEITLKSTNCHHTNSLNLLLLTITFESKLLLKTTNSSVTVYFNVLSVSQIISINPWAQSTPSSLVVPVNLVRDRTSLLIEFTSPHFAYSSSDVYVESCSTYDGKSSRTQELCELTHRNVSLNTRSVRKLLPRENVILNLQTARSATYLLSYYPSEAAKIEKELSMVEVVTSDKRFLTSVCFNNSLVGWQRMLFYFTSQGNASFDRKLLSDEVKAEQEIVVCEETDNIPVTLCTSRLVGDTHNPAHIEQRSRDFSVIVLSALCGVVVVMLGVVGCVAYRFRQRQLDKKCDYHAYMQPECDPPSFEVDYTGIEVVHSIRG